MRGLMMGCFFINLFVFLLVMEAYGGGLVPDYLPFLPLGSSILCLVGYHTNKDVEEEDE